MKPKNWGTNTSNSTLESAPATSLEEDAHPTFKLKKRAFKVFKVSLHKPARNDLPGEVFWSEFLLAMAATGFAPAKLDGSNLAVYPFKI